MLEATGLVDPFTLSAALLGKCGTGTAAFRMFLNKTGCRCFGMAHVLSLLAYYAMLLFLFFGEISSLFVCGGGFAFSCVASRVAASSFLRRGSVYSTAHGPGVHWTY